MSLFEKRTEISRQELRKELGRAAPEAKISRQKSIQIEKRIFPGKYGGMISKRDFMRGFNELKKVRFQTKNYSEKLKINKQLNILKKLGGV